MSDQESAGRVQLSGPEIGRIYAERLRAYLDDLKSEGRPLPSYRGKLNLSAIALACAFDRKVLYENPACKALVERAAAEHQLSPPAVQVQADSSEVTRLRAEKLRLEQHNAALRAENEDLRRKLRQFQHIEEHMFETGRRVIR